MSGAADEPVRSELLLLFPMLGKPYISFVDSRPRTVVVARIKLN